MPDTGRLPPVAIYRDHLLPLTEGFVTAQGEALRDFRPYYLGSKRVTGSLETPQDRTFVINDGTPQGRARELLFKTTGYVPGLISHLRAISPRLLHAHFGPDGVLTLPIARALGCPLIVTFHGFDAMIKDSYARKSFYLHRKYLRQRPQLQQGGTLFIAVSEFIRDRLLAQGFPEERTQVHYIGVDIRRFRPNPAVERQPIVLFVGRLSPGKGCDHLLRAMALVQHNRPDLTLVMIGDGPERQDLENLADRERVRVRFLGKRPQKEVIQWLNRAQIFAAPSMTVASGWCEAFGLTFAEAQAMGVPVAAYAAGGVREAVSHGRTGLLAPEGNWRELAKSILELAGNDPLREQMGAAGRRRVEQKFDLHRQSEKLEGLYHSVLQADMSFPATAAASKTENCDLMQGQRGSPALH